MTATAKRRALAAATESDPRWAAVLARDARADGRFYYSVQSTGVYCRPSCAARQARPENVRFHASCADAERAGFRPCRRCKPDQPPLAQQHAQKVAAACRLIDSADTLPDDMPNNIQHAAAAVRKAKAKPRAPKTPNADTGKAEGIKASPLALLQLAIDGL